MSSSGIKTCPHCRAIVQSSTCSICGKSALDAPAPVAPKPKQGWAGSPERSEVRKAALTFVVLFAIVGVGAYIFTRPDAPPDTNALPPPASTTTTEPVAAGSAAPPSLLGGTRPATGFAPQEIEDGLSPWENPPPVDFVSGGLLDESTDYSADIAHLAEVLAAAPPPLALAPLDPPELATFDGVVDMALVEATQPFAARRLLYEDGSALGQLWLVTSSGTTAGDAYLAAARTRWNSDEALEQFSPDVGLRVWLLARDTDVDVWAGEVDGQTFALTLLPTGTDPTTLTDMLSAWRAAISSLG